VRRVLAWTRNLRNAPPFAVVSIFATTLIALAIAFPLTAAMRSYTTTCQELGSEVIELNQSHQEYIATMHPLSGRCHRPPQEIPSPPRVSDLFVATQWTRVIAAKGESEDARKALGELCEVYSSREVTDELQTLVDLLREAGKMSSR
jgi:hypothetical protein